MVQSTAATISAYENATKNPSLEIVMNIAEKCNISIDWLSGLSDQKELKPEIKNYKDIAIRTLELLDLGMFPYMFEWKKTKLNNRNTQLLILPDEPKLLKFMETYDDLKKSLIDDKIQQHVIDVWLSGALEELKKIPLFAKPEACDEDHSNFLDEPIDD